MNILLIGARSARQEELNKLKKIKLLQRKKVSFFELDEKPAQYKVKELIDEQKVLFILNVKTMQMSTCHLASEIARESKDVLFFGIDIQPCPSMKKAKGQDLVKEIKCSTLFLDTFKEVLQRSN